jgi:hypothetical protein
MQLEPSRRRVDISFRYLLCMGNYYCGISPHANGLMSWVQGTTKEIDNYSRITSITMEFTLQRNCEKTLAQYTQHFINGSMACVVIGICFS